MIEINELLITSHPLDKPFQIKTLQYKFINVSKRQ